MTEPLRIAYLIEDTDLSGGVRVALAQADALIARGHHVTIATKGLPLQWRSSLAEWQYLSDFREIDASALDFVIATFWTTVRFALEAAGPEKTVHLCQGYEGDFTAYQSIHEVIESTYRLPVPKLVVAPHLVETLRRFSSDVTWIGQIVDDDFYRAASPADNDPPRVLLAGASQIDFKGIDIGYAAVAQARWQGASFELVRISPWVPSQEEPLSEHVQEFHVGLSSPEMVKTMHACDVFLGPSRRAEGFGLPAAEAMASGLPAVLTSIPSFLSFDARHDYALFADEEDGEGLGDRLVELLSDDNLRRQLRHRGREVVEQFRSARCAERIERFLAARKSLLS
jgi:glycosyltransferase involved in cell wall biosynthesis